MHHLLHNFLLTLLIEKNYETSNSLSNSATFVEKNFPDSDPIFCPVSGFCTSDCQIEKKINAGEFQDGPVFGFCTSDIQIEKKSLQVNFH